jgi:hypothetical protein
MALTRDFKETILARVQRDPAFRRALLREALESMIAGDWETGKAVLRNYINATEGFRELGREIEKSPKSLMRMLGPKGNPNAGNMFQILAHVQHKEGIRFRLSETGKTRIKALNKRTHRRVFKAARKKVRVMPN